MRPPALPPNAVYNPSTSTGTSTSTAPVASSSSVSISSSFKKLQGNLMKRVHGYRTLRQFVRELRMASTAQEAQCLIRKEIVYTRDTLLDHSTRVGRDQRWHALAKLIWIILVEAYTPGGGRADSFLLDPLSLSWAQMEVIRIAAGASRLRDKRLGYLAMHCLLDTRTMALTMSTNSIKIDLLSQIDGVAGVALDALATLATVEMAHDLMPELRRLISATDGQRQLIRTTSVTASVCNASLRHKAMMCACRVVDLDPDLSEHFIKDALEVFMKTSLVGIKSEQRQPISMYPGNNASLSCANTPDSTHFGGVDISPALFNAKSQTPDVSTHGLLLGSVHLLTRIVFDDLDDTTWSQIHNRALELIQALSSEGALVAPGTGFDEFEASMSGKDPFLQVALLELLGRYELIWRVQPEIITRLVHQSSSKAVRWQACALGLDSPDPRCNAVAIAALFAVFDAGVTSTPDIDIRFAALDLLISRTQTVIRALGQHQMQLLKELLTSDPDLEIKARAFRLMLLLMDDEDPEQLFDLLKCTPEWVNFDSHLDALLEATFYKCSQQNSCIWYVDHVLEKIILPIIRSEDQSSDSRSDQRSKRLIELFKHRLSHNHEAASYATLMLCGLWIKEDASDQSVVSKVLIIDYALIASLACWLIGHHYPLDKLFSSTSIDNLVSFYKQVMGKHASTLDDQIAMSIGHFLARTLKWRQDQEEAQNLERNEQKNQTASTQEDNPTTPSASIQPSIDFDTLSKLMKKSILTNLVSTSSGAIIGLVLEHQPELLLQLLINREDEKVEDIIETGKGSSSYHYHAEEEDDESLANQLKQTSFVEEQEEGLPDMKPTFDTDWTDFTTTKKNVIKDKSKLDASIFDKDSAEHNAWIDDYDFTV